MSTRGTSGRMVVHLVGTVDDLPRAAVITGGGSSPLECGNAGDPQRSGFG